MMVEQGKLFGGREMQAGRRSYSVTYLVTAVLAVVLVAFVAPPRASAEVVPYELGGTTIFGERPTALGLPVLPATGTFGAAPAEFLPRLREYHDSGRYEQDLASVARAARDYIAARLAEARRAARTGRECSTRYVATSVRHPRTGERLYRRVRSCRLRSLRPRGLSGRPALVLDIDETSLSNYRYLEATGFSQLGVAQGALLGGEAIQPTLELFRYAKSAGVAVFFVTGTPPELKQVREDNLRRVGYAHWDGAFYKPMNEPTAKFKSGVRAELERQGFDILANVGDQESDLAGGHADRSFKYPNPFYCIPN